ncbi:MAG: cell wall hydrolase [Patescibacteria group bacterium]
MQLKNYKDLAMLGLVIVTILAFQTQALFAQSQKSALRAYTDMSSVEAQDVLWLARILYSETKVREEQIIVAWVVRNRVESNFRGAESYKDVALSPSQFSGLWPSDSQYKLNISRSYEIKGDVSWTQALAIAQAVYFADDSLRPISENVRHFYSPEAVLKDPKWAVGKKPALVMRDSDKGTIRFAFYSGVK